LVADEELMTIGRFAEVSGLTTHALRHYDDIGLLAPAEVDPSSGYRRYRRGQVTRARLIQALRHVDLPIDEIRPILDDQSGDATKQILLAHRERLEHGHAELSARIADVDTYLERGITMAPTTKARPAQIKIAVDDADAAVAFYSNAFGFHYDVIRRTADAQYYGFTFGQYPDDDNFFLFHVLADAEQVDRPGPSTFGLLVDDLEVAHQRALDAGAVEVVKPQDAEGMPRCSAVKDPSGNWIWLYQDEV
jgi:DNA-binding transcriptional MerR regulator